MPRIRTRAGKGALLTNAEIDDMHKRGTAAISDDYTAQVSDNRDTLLVSGETTISLPVASVILGLAETGDWRVTVKNVGENDVTVEAVGGDEIDGNADITLAPGDCIEVQAVTGGYAVVAYAPVSYPEAEHAASADDSAELDGEEPSYYLARANHTGTQTMDTISDAGDLATKDTVNNGDWSGTDLAVTNGGTGASNASGARSNLGAAASDTTISAGNGLTGGGSLASNRTITLGTPGSTTVQSTNAVQSSSHTHELSLAMNSGGSGSLAGVLTQSIPKGLFAFSRTNSENGLLIQFKDSEGQWRLIAENNGFVISDGVNYRLQGGGTPGTVNFVWRGSVNLFT